jgi:hypothetical protein
VRTIHNSDTANVLIQHFGLHGELQLPLRYNVAPTQLVPVVRQTDSGPRDVDDAMGARTVMGRRSENRLQTNQCSIRRSRDKAVIPQRDEKAPLPHPGRWIL